MDNEPLLPRPNYLIFGLRKETTILNSLPLYLVVVGIRTLPGASPYSESFTLSIWRHPSLVKLSAQMRNNLTKIKLFNNFCLFL